MKMNLKMKVFCKNIDFNSLPLLPKQLENVLNEGIVNEEDCILFKTFAKKNSSSLEDCFDKTGYECLINKIHIDDFSKDPLPIAISFAKKLIKKLNTNLIRVIITYDIDSCTLRFNKIRKNESWLNEDIESYKEDGVLFIDS